MRGHRTVESQPAASRGQAETIGVVLVLAMTLIGATLALAYGAAGLNAARLDAQSGGVEHAMTQLDSRSAMTALGDSTAQHVVLATAGQGAYHVDPDAGWIRVNHSNYDGSGASEIIFNKSLGALVYKRGETLIAYQGGGVWVSSRSGSKMVSPPEFHYQGSTLTLPIIRVGGADAAGGGGVTAKITQETRARHVYPNLTRQYPASSRNFTNPVREGNVTVTIKSDFYRAWAAYFRTRTAGEVTVDHTAGTVSARLVSIGTLGDFEMPADGNSIKVRGLGSDHPLTNFTIRLRPDDADSADFANLQWTLYADEGSREFEIHLRDGGSAPDVSPCSERYVDITIYYSESGGDPYHGWHQDDAFVTGCADLNDDGDEEIFLEANLTGTTQVTMQSLSMSDLGHYDTGGDTFLTSVNFSEHGDVAWETKEFATTGDDDTTVGNLTNHYMELMGSNLELTVEDKGSDTVNEDASTGTFEQTGGGGEFITFLHITENRVTIELD